MNGPRLKIGDLVSAGALEFGDGYRTKRSEHGLPGYRIIRVADVLDNVVQLDGPDFVSEQHVRAIGSKIGQPGDILLTTKGTVGRVAVMPLTEELVVYSPQLCYFRVIESSIINPQFLRYWFGGKEFWNQANCRMNNTDMAAYINLADIRSLEITLPPISEQQAIAEVLGALDDKIALNNRLSATVDHFLAALFAQVTDDTSTIRLAEIASVNPATSKPIHGGLLRYIDISSVGQGTFDFPEVSQWNEAPSRARRHVQSGDTLWSTVRPNRRSHALNLADDELLVGSTGLAILRPREIGFAYLYEATKTAAFTAYLENVAEGSAYPAVRANRFEDAPVQWAATSKRESFEVTAAPLRRTQHSVGKENLRLLSVRDALLPHLMSGKLRVKEAEEIVAAAI